MQKGTLTDVLGWIDVALLAAKENITICMPKAIFLMLLQSIKGEVNKDLFKEMINDSS